MVELRRVPEGEYSVFRTLLSVNVYSIVKNPFYGGEMSLLVIQIGVDYSIALVDDFGAFLEFFSVLDCPEAELRQSKSGRSLFYPQRVDHSVQFLHSFDFSCQFCCQSGEPYVVGLEIRSNAACTPFASRVAFGPPLLTICVALHVCPLDVFRYHVWNSYIG